MKKTLILIFLITVFLIISVGVLNASAASSGTCGTKLNWILDDEGTLTISGTGAMADYAFGKAPWYNNSSRIIKVILSDGVTTIGS